LTFLMSHCKPHLTERTEKLSLSRHYGV
jgi:hypothetical protein